MFILRTSSGVGKAVYARSGDRYSTDGVQLGNAPPSVHSCLDARFFFGNIDTRNFGDMLVDSRSLNFENRVAVVTGAGSGLGRAYARLLAEQGARVIVNDLPRNEGASHADDVVAEIAAAGGQAVACLESVEDGSRIIEAAMDAFGRVDIVINNAGILQDRSFHKMTEEEWDFVYRVHLLGTFRVTHAAWPYLRDQRYGRIVCTTSGSGIYGAFGQANYAAAKMGTVGFVNSLALEGKSRNIHVNAIAPAAGSRITATVWPAGVMDYLKPEVVAPLVVFLCSEQCEDSGAVFEAGGGWVSRLRWQRTEGFSFPDGDHSPADVAERWEVINDFSRAEYPQRLTDVFIPASQRMPEDLRARWLGLAARSEGGLG